MTDAFFFPGSKGTGENDEMRIYDGTSSVTLLLFHPFRLDRSVIL
jgi:hypothetical protein